MEFFFAFSHPLSYEASHFAIDTNELSIRHKGISSFQNPLDALTAHIYAQNKHSFESYQEG